MNLKLPFVLALLLSYCCSSAQLHFNKKDYYEALSKTDLSTVQTIEQVLISKKEYSPFLGALFMKKSGLISDPSEKIKIFKTGREKLETAILLDSSAVEWRFLRLLIQENSPKLVRYNQEINQDASYLRANYSKLDAIAQNALYTYCQTSRVLNLNDFKKLKHD